MDVLDELLIEAGQPGFHPAKTTLQPRSLAAEVAATAATIPRSPSIAKVSYTHDGMIDLIIANPAISQGQLAKHFGYSASWVSTIIASDAFQSRLAERSADLIDPTIRATVKERFEGLVLRSMEILQEKLSKPSGEIPDQLALRALEISTRAAGYGAKADPPAVNSASVHIHLEDLGNNLTQLLRRRKAEIGSEQSQLIEQIAGG